MQNPISASVSMPGTRTLVERDIELDVLEALVATAAEGRGGSAHVLGPAGAGKTAVVRAVGAAAGSRGLRWWLASAGQLEKSIPFGVVRRLLDAPVRALSAEQRRVLKMTAARLSLSHLWASDVPHGQDAAVAPTQGDMLHSLGWLLEELVGDGPVLLTVDDAQWADEESLLLLGALRDRLGGLPVVVVTAARDESLDRTAALSALVADRDAVLLRLAPLSGAGVTSVLGERWPDLPSGTANAVLDVTGGNPFLVHALADALPDEPVAPERVRAAVPATVVDLMVSRLAGLPGEEQALARAVAVLDSATLRDAATLAGLDPVVAAAAADHLRRAGLLADGSGLSFRHALLRSAVYALIGPDTRDLLHRSAARLFATAEPSRAVGHLLATTGTGDVGAVDQLRTAAAEAIAVGAPQSAVTLLRRALAEPPGEDQLADLLAELGLAELRTFDPECTATLLQALTRTTDPVARVQRSLTLAAAYAFAGRHVEGADILDETLNEVDGREQETLLMVIAAWAAIALLIPARVAEARTRLAAFAGLPGATAGERLVVMQQLYLAAGDNASAATIRTLTDRVIGPWATPEQYPESGDWVWPRIFLGRIGEYDAVRRLTDEGLAHARSTGSVAGMIAAAFVRALSEYDAGDLASAEVNYLEMLEHHGGGLLIQMLGYAGLAETLALQGRIDEARSILARFPDALPPGTPTTGAALIWDARASVAVAAGDHEDALRSAEQLRLLLTEMGVDSPTWVSWRPVAIEALSSLGRLAEATQVASEHRDMCERSGVPHLVGEALCISGRLATDPGEGIVLARSGVAMLASTGSRLRAGRGALMLGSLLRRSGNKIEAREYLRNAVAVLTDCGAIPAAEFARVELAATGVRLTRAQPRLLTPSERRVAELALAGLGNPEIAARLHVTRKTVETHLSAVYRKLAITSRDQLDTEALDT